MLSSFTFVAGTSRIVGEELPGVDGVYVRRVRAKLRAIWDSQDHPLHEELEDRLISVDCIHSRHTLADTPTRSLEGPSIHNEDFRR